MQQLYGRGYLEMLDYRVVQDPAGDYGLDFTARRNSWGPNYLRFGVQLQDDFQGNTIFNAAGRLDFTELNSLGAESVWDAAGRHARRCWRRSCICRCRTSTRYFIAPHTLTRSA